MLCNEPLTAAALAARRQKTDDKAAEEGKKATRISEIDVWPVVVANGFRNTWVSASPSSSSSSSSSLSSPLTPGVRYRRWHKSCTGAHHVASAPLYPTLNIAFDYKEQFADFPTARNPAPPDVCRPPTSHTKRYFNIKQGVKGC